MVVVSGSWGKNAATYPTPTSNDMVITDSNKMSAKAILVCRPNSHPFQDRTLCLDQPVKVGRSVARTKATPTNATFDCKVLSRNHALLWYDNGKFFLQDTKSSNGTYVNNNRLSSDELEAHEVSSGDIVQFGVDVVENNRKVTHGCIIAMLKLYLPDGKEAKASPSITEGHEHGYVPLDELYKLNQVLQDASQREVYLETKLNALQQVVNEARNSADECWQTYVGEERLLSRVAVLERQLLQAGKGWNDEKMKEELDKLQEERALYETTAKEKLRKLHDERLDALATAAEQEKARATAEQECILVKEQLLQAQEEIQAIALKLTEEQQKINAEKTQYEQRERELRSRLELECEKLNDLQLKLDQLKCVSINANCNICDDDLNRKIEMLDEELEVNCNMTIASNDNDINLTVAPVEAVAAKEGFKVESDDNPDDMEQNNHSRGDENDSDMEKCNLEKEDLAGEQINVDSRTLKYQFQTAQNELKKQIERLEAINESNQLRIKDMENALFTERQVLVKQQQENEFLREEISNLKQNLKDANNESQQLRDKLSLENLNADIHKECKCAMSEGNGKLNGVNLDQFTALEEELVFLKEKYANLSQEKLILNKELKSTREQYNVLCNKSHNKMFFYIVPLALMVLYLLISNMFS